MTIQTQKPPFCDTALIFKVGTFLAILFVEFIFYYEDKIMRIKSLASLIVIASTATITTACSTSTETANAETEQNYELLSMKTDQDVYNATADKSAVISVQTEYEEPEPAQQQTATPIEDIVYFEFDSKELTTEAKTKLEKLADEAKMAENNNLIVSLKGFADATGPEEYNQDLSKERANSVKEFLKDNGVEAREYEVVALGESNPAADNDTKEGRAENRRVVLLIETTNAVASF